jgi:3-oxoacyl-[acyl-carrier-protein] synthase I
MVVVVISNVHIIDFSAVTSAGATTAVAMTAERVGFASMSIDPEGADEEDEDTFTTNVARITALTEERSGARAWQLLEVALEQVAEVFDQRLKVERIWVAAQSRLAVETALQSWGERKLGPRKGDFVVAVERGGSLFAVQEAFGAIQRGQVDVALVAGVEVGTQPRTLVQKADRTLGPDRSFGFVPGEAAAALVLASDSVVRQSKWRARGKVVSVGGEKEIISNKPCTGAGLTNAIQKALTVLPEGGRVAEVLCNLNGERWQTDEWGFTVPRIAPFLRDPSSFKTSTSVFGDCGAADGLLLIAMAVHGSQRESEGSTQTLLWTISDEPERMAAVIEVAKATEPHRRPIPVSLPSWAFELDRRQLDLFAEECAFRHEQRLYLLEQSAAERWQDWRSLETNESVTDELVAGLVESGPRGRAAAAERFDAQEPGSVYAALRVSMEQGEIAEAVRLTSAIDPGQTASVIAARHALTHARSSFEAAKKYTDNLISSAEAHRHLAIEVATQKSVALSVETVTSLASDVPPAHELSFVRALGLTVNAELVPLLPRWLESSDPSIRLQAALSYLLMVGKGAERYVISRAKGDSAFLVAAALVADQYQTRALIDQAAGTDGPQSALALALIGTPMAVPRLVERLRDPSSATEAVYALELILGSAPLVKAASPELDSDASDQAPSVLSTQPADWQCYVEPVATRFSADTRLRSGLPATRQSTAALLNRPSLSPKLRSLLAYELTLRWAIRPLFDPRTFRRDQARWFSRYAG